MNRSESEVHRLLFDLIFLLQVKMKEIVREADDQLSAMQILLLRTLTERGKMSQREIAETLGKDKSQITRLIAELEQKHLLTKERDRNDKRSFLISPAGSVRKKVARYMKHEARIVSTLLHGIETDKIQELERILMQMKQNLQQESALKNRG